MSGSFARYLCLSVDAQGYGKAADPGQSAIQEALLDVLSVAAAAAGLDRAGWLRQGKGDEELALIPAGGPELETRVVDGFVGELAAALFRRNCDRPPGARLRLRLAIDGGPAAPSSNGFAGRPVITASRLAGSQPLRRALAAAPDASLAVLLSRQVYGELVLAGHSRLRPADFRRVDVHEKELADEAWLRVPGVDVHRLRLAPAETVTNGDPNGDPDGDPDGERDGSRAGGTARDQSPPNGRSAARPTQAVINEFRAAVDASQGVIGIRNDR